MKNPATAPLAGNAATAPVPPRVRFELTRIRLRGWADRRRYRDRVPSGQHTHFTRELAATALEWMRVVDLWEAECCSHLTLELATQRAVIAQLPPEEPMPQPPTGTGDSPRDRVAQARWRESARAAQGRNATAAAARIAAARRQDELLADIETVRELAWDARRRIEERYRIQVAVYERARYRYRYDTRSEVGVSLPPLGDMARYGGTEIADRPGRGSYPDFETGNDFEPGVAA